MRRGTWRIPVRSLALIGDLRPDEMYNLAGGKVALRTHSPTRVRRGKRTLTSSSHLLDAIRRDSPCTRSLSGVLRRDVWIPGRRRSHPRRNKSPLNPQSPYAAAKAAAHLLCRSSPRVVRPTCRLWHLVQPRVEASRGALPQSKGNRPCRDPPPRFRRTSASRKPQGTAGLGVCSRLCGGDDQSPSSKHRFAAFVTFRASIATAFSVQGICTAYGSSSTERSFWRDSSWIGTSTARIPLRWQAERDSRRGGPNPARIPPERTLGR